MAFLSMTSLRHVPAFFLGCVFIAGLWSIISSSVVQEIFIYFRHQEPDVDDEKTETIATSAHILTSRGEPKTLFIILYFCFVSASITFFSSLLTFPLYGAAACAFVVAWSGITSQVSRIVGFLILFMDLRRRGVARWETLTFLALLLVDIAFIFANNAVETGSLSTFSPLPYALCERKHFLPTSLVLSVAFMMSEVYLLVRVWNASTAPGLKILTDYRVLRAASLLLLELLTVFPSAVYINIVADSVPYSIGSLAVLAAFRIQHRPEEMDVSAVSPSYGDDILQYREPSTFTRSITSGARSFRWPSQRSRFTTSTRRTSYAPPVPTLIRHPFASAVQDIESARKSEWIEPPLTARRTSGETIDSRSSITSAIVQTAQRVTKPYPFTSHKNEGFQATLDSYLPSQLSPAPNSASILLGRPIVPSQNALADSLGLETKLPPKAAARPQLSISVNPIPQPASQRDNGAILVPIMEGQSLHRLTPTFASSPPADVNRQSLASTHEQGSSENWDHLRRSVTSTVSFGTMSTSQHHIDSRRTSTVASTKKGLSRSRTFGSRSKRARAAMPAADVPQNVSPVQ